MDWADIDPFLGRMTDKKLAQQSGRSLWAIWERRTKKGIIAFSKRNIKMAPKIKGRKGRSDWGLWVPMMGRMTDRALSEISGISRSSIVAKRIRENIQPFRQHEKKKKGGP